MTATDHETAIEPRTEQRTERGSVGQDGGTADDTAARRTHREAVVAEHMRAEMAGELDATLATFTGGEAEYDIVPLPAVHRGEEVRHLLAGLLGAFPDLGLHALVTRHADDAVIIEGVMTGTHLGPYAGFEPTGRSMELRAAIFFTFDDTDLRRETVYYDELTLLGQLGVLPEGFPPAPPS